MEKNEEWLLSPDDVLQLRYHALTSNNNVNNNVKQVKTLPKTSMIAFKIESSAQQLLQTEEIALIHFCHFIFSHFYHGHNATKTLQQQQQQQQRFPHWRVPFTAVVFLRRFYLNNTFADYDPRIMTLASVFLAGKIEESLVELSQLLPLFPKLFLSNEQDGGQQIFAFELALVESLNYQLQVYHSQNILHTLIADFKRWCEESTTAATTTTTTTTTIGDQSVIEDKVVDADQQSNKRIKTETDMIVEMTQATTATTKETRREWRLLGEELLVFFQCSERVHCFTSTEISVIVLRLVLQQQQQQKDSELKDLKPLFDEYLLSRFGKEMFLYFEENDSDINNIVHFVKQQQQQQVLETICQELNHKNTKKEQ